MLNKEFTTWAKNEEGLPARITVKEGRVEIVSPVDLDEDPFLDVVRGPVENLTTNENEIRYTAACDGKDEELLSRGAKHFGDDGSVSKFMNEYESAECEDRILILDMSAMCK